jgi:hypothetical protein
MAIARTWASVLEDEQQLVLGETMVRVSTLQPMLDASWSRAAPVPAFQADAPRTRGLGLPLASQARRFSLHEVHCQTG